MQGARPACVDRLHLVSRWPYAQMPRTSTPAREPNKMRTNIEIDEQLMAQALKLTGLLVANERWWKRACGWWFYSQPGQGAEDAQGLGLGRRP